MPNAENYYPLTPNIASNYGDDHVVAQIKPPTPQSEDRSLTSIKEENSLLLVENKKQKEEIAICYQQNRSLNQELNCLSEKLQQSLVEKKDLQEKIIVFVLQHAFLAALEENNKLKEHSWTQVAFSSKPNRRKSEVPTQNFRTSTNNSFEGLLDETFEEYVPDVENMDVRNFFASDRSLRR